jgi:predicted metal-dependent hydrolase
LNTTLHIEDLQVSITFKRMKSIRLRVCAPTGEVKLSAPRGVSQDVIRRFVETKLPWIRDHRQKIRSLPPALVWQRFDKATQQQYRAQLLEQLPPLIARYEQALNVSVASFNLRHMKTRWGSCHPRKRHICFNLELVRYSHAQLEYVVVHELAHLRVAAHNHRFYALLDEVMPDWRERKKVFRDGLGL